MAAELQNAAELTEKDEKNYGTKDKTYECPVCLQKAVHPTKLPCGHIFCFLCIKGVAHRSKRCALCRNEIPVDYFNDPLLLDKEDIAKDLNVDHDGYQWYYEGRNGWWQYDERTSTELEQFYAKNEKVVEMLIAGFLYIIDFNNMLQMRRNDPMRRRRIKRDFANIRKKGIAGIKVDAEPEHSVSPTSLDATVPSSQQTHATPPPDAPPNSDTSDLGNDPQSDEDNDLVERLDNLEIAPDRDETVGGDGDNC